MTRRFRSAGAVLGILASLAWVFHALAPEAANAFWSGSLGSRNALLSGTLVRAVPLCIVGTAIAIAFRAGVFNIGGEGQLLLGAVAATAVALWNGPGILSLPLALLAAMVAGAGWAGIAGVLRARFGVLEVISTIMLNFVAMNLVSWLVRGPLQEPTRIYPQTSAISEAARLPRIAADLRLHYGLVLAGVVCVAAWWFATRSAAGFRQRVVGAAPAAARAAGRIDVRQVALRAMLASGALAGLAGGIEITGVTFALYEHVSPGYGFSAIAVAVLARLNPLAVVPSALLFATLQTGALGMQRDAGVPSTLAATLEATAILLVVALHGWHRVAPRARPAHP